MNRIMQWGIILLVAGLSACVNATCTGCQDATDIQAKETSLDFQGACGVYKTAYVCNTDCPDVQKNLTKYVSDVCEAGTNTLNGCGKEINECLNDLKKAQDDAEAKKSNTSCSDLNKFIKCSFAARAECSNRDLISFMSIVETQVSETEMEIGCEGKCAKGIGKCLDKLAKVTSAHPDIAHFKQMCTDLGLAQKCIKDLGKGDCKGEKNFPAAEQMVELTKESFSDLCGNNGEPTMCSKDFVACRKTLDTVKKDDLSAQCKDLSNFVTCAEDLPCKNALKPLIKATVVGAESEETDKNCPVVGGCRERIDKCVATAKALKIEDKENNIDKFCEAGSKIESCFNIVDSDDTCDVDEATVSDLQKLLFAEIGTECGDVSACGTKLEKCYGIMKNVSSVPKADVCPLFKKWSTCTDGIVKSLSCRIIKQDLRAVDKEMGDQYKGECGNGSTIKASLIILVVAVFAYIWK